VLFRSGTAFTSDAPFSSDPPFPCRNEPPGSPKAGCTKDSLWPNPKGLLNVADSECEPPASAGWDTALASWASTIPLVFRFFFLNIFNIIVMETITPKR
jgi:hypothetical protein